MLVVMKDITSITMIIIMTIMNITTNTITSTI